MGELKIALMPAAVPQPMSSGMCWRVTRKSCPTPLATPAPIWTIGPSAPADPPVPMVMPAVMIFSTADNGRMNPLERKTLSITSTMPLAFAGAERRIC